MNLHILFIQRKESYHEQYAPEALVVWDEYSMEANPEGFEEACEKALKDAGDEVMASTVVVVSVNQAAIRERLVGHLKLDGKIKDVP